MQPRPRRVALRTGPGRAAREGAQWARVSIGGSMLNITDRAQADATRGLHRGHDHIGIHTTDFDASVQTLRNNGVVFYVEPYLTAPGRHATVCPQAQ